MLVLSREDWFQSPRSVWRWAQQYLFGTSSTWSNISCPLSQFPLLTVSMPRPMIWQQPHGWRPRHQVFVENHCIKGLIQGRDGGCQSPWHPNKKIAEEVSSFLKEHGRVHGRPHTYLVLAVTHSSGYKNLLDANVTSSVWQLKLGLNLIMKMDNDLKYTIKSTTGPTRSWIMWVLDIVFISFYAF